MSVSMVAAYGVNSAGSDTTTLTTSSFTPATGEVIVVMGINGTGRTYGTPTASANSITWTKQVEVNVSTYTYNVIWTGDVTAGGSACTVSLPFGTGTSSRHSMCVQRYTGAQVGAATCSVQATGGTTTTTLTTTADNSYISWCNGDVAFQNTTPTYESGAVQDWLFSLTSTPRKYFMHQSCGTAGAQTVGMTAPTGQTWNLTGIEIQPHPANDFSDTAALNGSGSLTGWVGWSGLTTFDAGDTDGWTTTTAGSGTVSITSGAAHDGAFGAAGNVPAATGDQASLSRTIGPGQQATISGWWKVTTEGASSTSNVPFARLFYGSQRLADVYRQNAQAGANVWLRVTKAAGTGNYWFIPTGYTLPLNTWVYVSFKWALDGTPSVSINGTEYINASNKPADWFAAAQIDAAYLGSQETGNQGAWAIDTVTVSVQAATAALSGSGSLTATNAPSVPAAATLSGSGTLTATTQVLTTATLSGAGSLTASGTPALAATAPLSGLGALTATAAPSIAQNATLAGSGSLTATASNPAISTTAALSGSGTLTGSVSGLAIGTTAALSGAGTLSVTTTPATGTTAALAGGGALSAASVPSIPATAPLSGSGTLTGQGDGAASGPAALSGTGSLTGTTSPSIPTAATLTGSGQLTATTTISLSTAAVLAGGGTLTAAAVPVMTDSAPLSGSGTLAAATSPGFGVSVSLSGTGILAATSTPTIPKAAALSGAGVLAASSTPMFADAAHLAGSGVLVLVASPAFSMTVQLSGSGVLTSTGFSGSGSPASLSGTGTLTVERKRGGNWHAGPTRRRWSATIGARRWSTYGTTRRWKGQIGE